MNSGNNRKIPASELRKRADYNRRKGTVYRQNDPKGELRYSASLMRNSRKNSLLRYGLVLLAGTVIILLALMLVPNRNQTGSNSPNPQGTSQAVVQSDTAASENTETAVPGNDPAGNSGSEIDGDSTVTSGQTDSASADTAGNSAEETDPSGNSSSDPADSEIESASDETQPETEAAHYLLSEAVFIGDSRTVFMGTDAERPELSSGMISNDRLFATFGGCLDQESAFQNAENAALTHPKCAVFWYGVNDLQVNPERNDEYLFQRNYQAVIEAYVSVESGSDIYVLSLLNTDTDEKDYYADQNTNLKNYNRALQELCSDYGYTYVDVTPVFTGSSDFYEDNIHFTAEFYGRLIPYMFEIIGISGE